jgi:nucleoside-diphosphate-sugar epimerase
MCTVSRQQLHGRWDGTRRMTIARVLVTGASGLIGSHTVGILFKSGYKIVALYRKQEREMQIPWGFVLGNLLDDSILSKLAAVEFDIAVHCAAVLPDQFHGDEAERAAQANSLMDERITDLCASRECRLVYISSTSVYGPCSGSSLMEESDVSPIGPYAVAKVESERKILKELSGSSAILRVSAPYGSGQRAKTVLRLFIKRALANLDLMYHGTGERQQDFTAACDVSDAILRIVSKDNVCGIFNIAGGHPISMRDLAHLVVRSVAGTKSRVVPSGQPDPQEHYRPAFDISKARRVLGWYPCTTLEQGIYNWAEHLRKHE